MTIVAQPTTDSQPQSAAPARAPLPVAAQLTFVFTDIERSTRLLEQLGARYGDVLATHGELIRGLLTVHDGHEVDTQGDAFFCVFVDPSSALAFAGAVQRRLAAETWPEGVDVRLRIGIHTGAAELRRTGYIGMDVHAGARVAAAGHGGQVLVSAAAANAVEGREPPDLSLTALGSFRLKDLREPVELFELAGPGLASGFPPPRTLDRSSEPPAPGEPPYLGLAHFEEADAHLFFGRETLVEALSARLRAESFLVIVGASGSGKSSLLRAGLIPALRQRLAEAGAAGAAIALLTPTEAPLDALTIALEAHPAPPAVIAVDQFEELFTLVREDGVREAFIAQLLSLLDGGAALVVTLRADFYDQLAPYDRLRALAAEHQEYLGPLSREDLHLAIEGPAEQGGWRFDPGLVELIVHDVGDEPGALPLLSHAIRETWARRSGTLLTLRGYLDAGGVQGAIARTADETIGALEAGELSLARDILLRLTELGEETPDTRRRAGLDELVAGQPDPAAARAILDRLVSARLVVLEGTEAEVAHEALIREWPTLREWLEEDREGLRLGRLLTVGARDWEASERDPGLLLRGARLASAREWLAVHASATSGEHAFVEASLAAERAEAAEREAARQRELEAARTLAASEASAAARLRRRAVLLAALLVVALGLAGFSYIQSQRADQATVVARSQADLALDRAREAVGRQLAAQSQVTRADLSLATLLALESLEHHPSPDAWVALIDVLGHTPEVVTRQPMPEDVIELAVSPDGAMLAVAARTARAPGLDAPSMRVVDVATGSVRHGPIDAVDMAALHPVLPFRSHLGFSPDGARLVFPSSVGLAVLDLANDRVEPVPGVPVLAAHSVTWRPSDGRLTWVSSGVSPSELSLVHADLESGAVDTIVLSLPERAGGGLMEPFGNLSPDGRYVVVSERAYLGPNGAAPELFDATTGEHLGSLPGAFSGFSHDGTAVAAGTEDGFVVLSLPGLEQVGSVDRIRDAPFEVLWAEPDVAKRRLYLWRGDQTVEIHDLEEGFVVREPADIAGWLQAAAVADGGTRVIHRGDSLEIVDIERDSRFAVPGLERRPSDASEFAVSGDGGTLAEWTTWSDRPTVSVLVSDVATGALLREIRPSDPSGIAATSLSYDGRELYSLHASGVLIRTSVLDGVESPPVTYDQLDLHPSNVAWMATSPSGVVAVVEDGRVLLFDRDGRTRTLAVQGGPGADFLPDGLTLLVADCGGRALRVVDTVTATVTSALPVGRCPMSIDADADGTRILVNSIGQDGGSHLDLYSWPGGALIGSIDIGPQAHVVRFRDADDGRSAVSVGYERIAGWDVDPASWQEKGCALAGRDLTAEEWERYLGDEASRATCAAA